MGSVKTIIKKVKLIEEYCHANKQWPMYNHKNNATKKWDSAYKLRRWLYNTGYMTGNFKYADIVDENNVNLKEILDSLYEQYGVSNKQRIDERMKNWVDELEEYCRTYQEWPMTKSKYNKTKQGTTGKNLYDWLKTSGYILGNFKYAYVVDENGISIKEKLDRLYQQYYKDKLTRTEDNKKKWVDLVEEYCKIYQEWPISTNFEDKTKEGITAAQLRTWLGVSGYATGNFKYAHIIDENGVSLKERLDRLVEQYGNGRGAVLRWIEWIKEYLMIYQEWPTKNNTYNQIKNGITSAMLYDWLHRSGYLTSNFKYTELIDENGISLKDKIDTLFAIFADNNQIVKLEGNIAKNLNLWRAKDSDKLGLTLYYLVIQLKLSYKNEEKEKFEYFKALLSSKLTNNFLNLDVEELIDSFQKPYEERIELYYKKWKYLLQQKIEIAVLFRYLMEYEKVFYVEPVKTKIKER